jgi:hypothetical protein
MRWSNKWWHVYAVTALGLAVVLATMGGRLALQSALHAAAVRTPPPAGTAARSPQDAACLGGGTLSSTELYHPTTGTWSSGPDMTIARENAAVVTLSDGRILVAGGMCYSGQLDVGGTQTSAEIYDPVANTWTAVAPMHDPRASPAAVLLPNGTALVVGGEDNSTRALPSAEIYNPATNQWTVTGSMPYGRIGPSATVLRAGPNAGDVLIVGGVATDLPNSGYFTTQTELFNPTTGQFSLTGSLPGKFVMNNEGEFVFATLPNDNVFLGGGMTAEGESGLDNIYNVQTGQWTAVHRQGVPPRVGGVGVTLPSGSVLAIGGIDMNACNADVYTPGTGRWTEIANPMLDCGLMGASALLLSNGQVLVSGGWASRASALTAQATVTTDCELYDPSAQTWTATGSLLHARRNAMAAILTTGPNAGGVLIAGGDDGSGVPQPPR